MFLSLNYVEKKMYSPFDCRNDNIDFIQIYKKFRKNAKISFIISIIYLILCFIKIILRTIKTKEKKKIIA